MNFTRPFDREDILSLSQTKQPFRDSSCYYRRYKRVAGVQEIDGREYVTIESWYGNGMRPGTQMTMADAVRYLNEAPGLEFLPIYY